MRPTRLVLLGQPVNLVAPPRVPRPRLDPPPQQVLPAEPETEPACGPGPGLVPAGGSPAGVHGREEEQAMVNRLVAGHTRVVLEVLQHQRSPQQLGAVLAEEAELVVRAWSRRRGWRSTGLVGVRGSRIGPRVVEGVAHLADRSSGHRFSVALRLEHRYGRWRTTVFEVLLPPALMAERLSVRGTA